MTQRKMTKGERTARYIMDVAERLFAERGFDATPLRDIAAGAGIREPGLYNHFASKEALYRQVLQRGLQPLQDAIERQIDSGPAGGQIDDLPGQMLDLLAEHPNMAMLFCRAQLSADDAPGGALVNDWLVSLFRKAEVLMAGYYPGDRSEQILQMIGMFSLVTGFFLNRRIYRELTGDELVSAGNLALQRRLVSRIYRSLGKETVAPEN